MNKEIKMTYRYKGKPRKVRQFSGKVLEIDSEPGDATRYRYIIIDVGPCFHIINHFSEMNYPDRLQKWELNNKPEKISEQHDCNPWTAKEVLTAIKNNFEI